MTEISALVDRVTSFLDFDKRILYASAITAVFFGGILAFVYTFMGGPSYVSNEAYAVYDSMFFVFAGLLSLPFAGLMYYFTRDVSLSLAPVVGAMFSLFSGFEDVMVYVFCSVRGTGACSEVSGLPGTWPWLEGHYVGYVSRFLGFDTVTDISILLSVLFGFVFSLFLLKILDVLEKDFLGVSL